MRSSISLSSYQRLTICTVICEARHTLAVPWIKKIEGSKGRSADTLGHTVRPCVAPAMTVVQIRDYQSRRKAPLQNRQRHRGRLHEYNSKVSSGVLIASGMMFAWVVLFTVVASVGSYLG